MNEERIKQAAETIHSTNNRIITEGILCTIAAEARKEGIEALQNDLKKWPVAGVVWISVDALDKAAERLKEQG